MNKSKIEWCDYTWNPVTGCLHNCEYCYARRIANRFGKFDGSFYLVPCKEKNVGTTNKPLFELNEKRYQHVNNSKPQYQPYPFGFVPTFHKYRLDEPEKIKKPAKIFVCSMADLFGDWVPDEWISEVYQVCQKTDHHQYLFLTKNPKRYSAIYRNSSDFRINMWFGTTVTDEEDFNKTGYELFKATGDYQEKMAKRFLSVEPLLGEIGRETLKNNLEHFDWVIIGAQTGPGTVLPKPEWVQSIIDKCIEAGVPVFLKDNLKWHEKIQEFPEGLK